MKTRDEVRALIVNAQSAQGFAASDAADMDAALDAVVAAQASMVGDPVTIITAILTLLPTLLQILQNDLPAVIALIKQIFGA